MSRTFRTSEHFVPTAYVGPTESSVYVVSVLLLVAALGFMGLALEPTLASDFDIVPDSTEFAVGAANFASGDGYMLKIDGRELPPRYPPWFSVLMIAPVFVFGSDLGQALWPVTLCGMAALVLVFLIARRLGSTTGGAVAAIVVFALPMFRFWGRRVMSDIPTLMLILLSLWILLGRREAGYRRRYYSFAGAAVNLLAFLFRPVAGAVFVPWILLALTEPSWRRRGFEFSLQIGAVLLGFCANWIYNAAVFGDPARSGFHYWCGVPYDYPELYFSFTNILDNWPRVLDTRILWYCAGAAAGITLLLVREFRNQRRRRAALTAGIFCLCVVPLITAFHLIYYMPRPRYFLPVIVVLLTVFVGTFGRYLQKVSGLLTISALLLAMSFVATWRATADSETPARRLGAEEVASLTTEQATVITGLPLPYLEYIANPLSTRRLIPYSRRDEYASKVLTPRRIESPHPAPMHPLDHRCVGLLNAGADEAVRRTALESLEELHAAAKIPGSVFIETSTFGEPVDSDEWRPLLTRFRLERRGNYLYELFPK